MNVNKMGIIAVFAAMLMLFSVFVSAEEALPTARLDDGNATIAENSDAENSGAEDANVGNGNGAGSEVKAERVQAREQVREQAQETLSISAESLGDGLTSAERQRFGKLMSALAKRASELRAESDLTGELRARYIGHLNDALHKYRQTARAEMQERVQNLKLEDTVARQMALRVNVTDIETVVAEIDPETVLEELNIAEDTKARIKARLLVDDHGFWRSVMHRMQNNERFRQQFQDLFHRIRQTPQDPAVVIPGVEAQPEYVRRLGPEYVRQHFDIESIRNRLRNRAHTERQTATALPEIVQDMRVLADIYPFVVENTEAIDAAIAQPE